MKKKRTAKQERARLEGLGRYFDRSSVNEIIGIETNPCLYILMRSDLASLNPGKAMAQASHAANAMVHKVTALRGDMARFGHLKKMYERWSTQTHQGFGTCLVLDCHSEQKMLDTLHSLHKADESGAGILTEVIKDPTYPVRDGEITHFISVNTCAYVFMDKNDDHLRAQLSFLDLYK
jgi:hypothetical protein